MRQQKTNSIDRHLLLYIVARIRYSLTHVKTINLFNHALTFVLQLSPMDMDRKILRAVIRSDFIRYYCCGRRPLAFPCIGGRSIDGVRGRGRLTLWYLCGRRAC